MRKVKVTFYGETGKSITSYYFSSEKLIRWIDNDKINVEKSLSKFKDKKLETKEDMNFIRSEIVE